jgi:hypothetical protein
MRKIQQIGASWGKWFLLACFCLGWGSNQYIEAAIDSNTDEAAVHWGQVLTATTPVSRAVAANRWTNANSFGSGPFAVILDDHFRQSEIAESGLRVTRKGITCGADHLWSLADARNSLRLGAIAGYLDGDVHPSYATIAWKQKFFNGAAFAAYESFNGKNLKTNVNLFAGLQRTEDRFPEKERGLEDAPSRKLAANGQFAILEGVKILRQWENMQIGPWALISYSRVNQNNYWEDIGACEFLDTIIGINFAKEYRRNADQPHTASAFLKCGWQQQQIFMGHTDVAAYPGRNSFVIINELRANLNTHWSIATNLQAALAKGQNTYAVSISLGRDFYGLATSAREQVITRQRSADTESKR